MNPRTRTFQIPLALLVLTLALLVPAAAQAQERTVSVTADVALRVPNDSARVAFTVSRERPSRGAALRAASGGLRRVIAAVRQIPGVEPGDVVTKRVAVRRTVRGRRVVYRAAEGIGVTLHRAKNAGRLIDAAIGAGASGVAGPEYFVGDTERAFSKALAAAFDKAKAKATTLAAQAGATLGQAISIDDGTGPELLALSDAETGAGFAKGAPAPVRPGKSRVTATVHVVFALL